MPIPDHVRRRLVAQANNPTGPVGHVLGWIFGHRSSNVRRNRWAVELLEVKPSDRVIELGCGPGVAVAALASRARHRLVVGVDHSAVVLAQARRRNADAIKAGRVRLIRAPVEHVQVADGPFDAALAVNMYCGADMNATAAATSQPVPISPQGNARIHDASFTVPSICLAPVILVHPNGLPNLYIALDGWR
jgi:SAM-dependent methyltransferase